MVARPRIAEPAHRHGIGSEDIVHAYRNALHFRVSDDDMDMAVGPARNGALLEVGFIRAVDGEVVILHAMPVREKFL
ncbi:hypothetical protein K3U94_06920 [Mycolicibacter heraklionensis]|uniref:Toxin n=1 Tax=Mycolicibacter heraklionensis TaxID=512402 RepID=A0A9X7WK67_9MYCO|nr:hypothetical protein [Mycolicibacter heraklionensis]QZA08994.1 hypothetical protein K3U94_06920 [Mycolicibacter heraklionensis]